LEQLDYQYPDQSLLHGMVFQKTGSIYHALAFEPGRYTPMGWSDDVPAFIRRQPRHVQKVFRQWWGVGEQPSAKSAYIAVIVRGWPLPSIYSYEEVGLRVRDGGPRGAFRDHGGIVIPAPHRPNTGQAPFYAIVLPLKPVWPAFAVNSLLFACVVAIPLCLMRGARLVVRRRRIRRGWCPQCGYNLRANYADGCSECGWKRAADAMPSR
jgi:hypothetical protein